MPDAVVECLPDVVVCLLHMYLHELLLTFISLIYLVLWSKHHSCWTGPLIRNVLQGILALLELKTKDVLQRELAGCIAQAEAEVIAINHAQDLCCFWRPWTVPTFASAAAKPF